MKLHKNSPDRAHHIASYAGYSFDYPMPRACGGDPIWFIPSLQRRNMASDRAPLIRNGGSLSCGDAPAPSYGTMHQPVDIIVNDHMQQAYRYTRTQAFGQGFDPAFQPELTPPQMLELGVFCGKYMTDCQAEFPAHWFERAKLSPQAPDCSLNYYGVRASVSLRVWQEKGWIHPDDPRGWFQWYCRYYSGRRMPQEDARQIARWKAFKRHAVQVTRNCNPSDPFCRPKQRQALLQWAYDSRDL